MICNLAACFNKKRHKSYCLICVCLRNDLNTTGEFSYAKHSFYSDKRNSTIEKLTRKTSQLFAFQQLVPMSCETKQSI